MHRKLHVDTLILIPTFKIYVFSYSRQTDRRRDRQTEKLIRCGLGNLISSSRLIILSLVHSDYLSRHYANGSSFTFFSTFFFIANFCLFCQKGKSSVLTALPFCLFVFVSVLFLLCWESLLFFSLDLAPIHFLPLHPHLDHHVPPPPPLCPRRRQYAWPFRLMRQHAVCHCHHFRCHRCFGCPLFS
jgi:hypothetical protein